MLVSILGRATGDGLAIVGTCIFLWWLGAAASGAETYASFIRHAGAWYGQMVLIGLTWAFFQHASSGLRHLLLDTGAGYELNTNRMWAIVVATLPVILTAAVWLFIYYKGL